MAAADVLVVVGTGGMGMAIARRCGSGHTVLLADVGAEALDAAGAALTAEGHDVATEQVDVSDGASVQRLAEVASGLGAVRWIAHTAGVSPVQAPGHVVLAVDLVGVAHMLDAFGAVVAPGGAGVVISSMAGHLAGPLSPEDDAAVSGAAASDLASIECAKAVAGEAGLAYAFAKAAASVRVRNASVAWGRRGARVNSISPGVIATPMGQMELAGPSGDLMRQMVRSSGTGRLGTPDDIAAAAEFLLSTRSSFVTGTDLLADGGVVAAVRSGQLT